MRVYADNAATTMVSETALQAMLSCLRDIPGNPSSQHTPGRAAKNALENARDIIAQCLNASAKEITFTSGGTEADNQALISAAYMGAVRGKRHIVSTRMEHHAVLHTLSALARDGFDITLLNIPPDGIIRPAQIHQTVREDTCLVSVMSANNEIGTVQPVGEIGAYCRAHGIMFHTDTVAAAGHIPLDVQTQNLDFCALSGHKFHGPRGVGILYARRGMVVRELLHGGAQERGIRAGTENLPGICGMAAALRESCERLERDAAYLFTLRERLINGLLAIPDTLLNGDRIRRLPGNVNVSFAGVDGETLLLLLDQYGIAASTGSACASGSLDPSHVLLALGRSHELAAGTLRLTLSRYNTPEEIDTIIHAVKKAVETIRGQSG